MSDYTFKDEDILMCFYSETPRCVPEVYLKLKPKVNSLFLEVTDIEYLAGLFGYRLEEKKDE